MTTFHKSKEFLQKLEDSGQDTILSHKMGIWWCLSIFIDEMYIYREILTYDNIRLNVVSDILFSFVIIYDTIPGY